MVNGPEVKVATVDVESGDNMATLPVSRQHGAGPDSAAEKNNAANKEMELKNVQPKPAQRTSLFIVMSFVYAMLLLVVCVAYVISDVSTHRLPPLYYESFFTYLYGASILFLLYVFCFLLQESTCCNGGQPKQPKPKPEKKPKKQKPPKETKEEKDKAKEEGKKGKGAKGEGKEGKEKGAKPSPFQEEETLLDDVDEGFKKEVYPKKMKDIVREQTARQETVEVEAPPTPRVTRKRKTSQNDQSHGSFFLRVGAIAFGLGTMIYTGLEFGSFFEIPFDSPCHQILRGVNPLLQMIFTFMQMYFIFMNSRLNIHRFKVLARFGLMHVVATNICVWIRTLVLESLKEITAYHQRRPAVTEDTPILESIRQHTLRNAGTVMGTELNSDAEWMDPALANEDAGGLLTRAARATAQTLAAIVASTTTAATTTSTTTPPSTTTVTTTMRMPTTSPTAALVKRLRKFTTTVTTPSTTTEFLTTTASTTTSTTTEEPTTLTSTIAAAFSSWSTPIQKEFVYNYHTIPKIVDSENSYQGLPEVATNDSVLNLESLDNLFPAALTASNNLTVSCGRVDIMGTIVQDSAPYLYPFIIEYSLIGAAVIYVMWKHIGRNPRYSGEEDLEHRLEVMLSRRAVAMAHASQSGRVDCVGASKGLFFGLLLLVGSLICLILFFVLVRHPQFSLLAIYLADVSHCALMTFSVIAIFVGFCRVQGLKFRCEDQSDLNDILLRVSAFGLFVYSVFSIIAGSLGAFESFSEPNLLVMVTGGLAVLQVVLQLLFVADVSRRRVHLPEHDRSKPGRQIVTFLLICNVAMFAIYTFEAQKVVANPVQLDFYGFLAWSIVQRVCLPLCIFHRFHSAVTLAEVWKTTYKARLE